MMETFTQKKEKRYRYFTCEKDMKRINSICPLKRVPAAELKNLLLREIGSMPAKPEIFAGVMHQIVNLVLHCFYNLPMVSVNFFHYSTQPFEGVCLLFHILFISSIVHIIKPLYTTV